MTYVTIIHPHGPKVRARLQVIVESEDGTQILSLGEGELDVQMVSLMPPTEYAVRHLWSAFLEAALAAQVQLPKLYRDPIAKPHTS